MVFYPRHELQIILTLLPAVSLSVGHTLRLLVESSSGVLVTGAEAPARAIELRRTNVRQFRALSLISPRRLWTSCSLSTMASTTSKAPTVVVDTFDSEYADAHPENLSNGHSPDSVLLSEATTPAPPDDEEDDVQGRPIDITKWHGPTTIAEVSRLKLTRAKRTDELVEACGTMISCLGEDLHREGLLKTPQRMAKALQYFTSGYETCLKGT